MPELMQAVEGERNPSVLCDVVASNMITRLENKQAILECLDVDERMKLLLRELADEIQIGELEERIHARVHEYMDKANHEYYLREQIHAIQEELGEDEDEEVTELRKRIQASKLPPAAREHVEKELKRLAKDLKGLEGEIVRATKMLGNPGFVSKAPAHLVEAEKEKLETNKKLLDKLKARIAEMESLR